jgi:chorismate synthase
MKNTFGTSVCLTVFGESHGPFIGAVLDGLAPGIDVSDDDIRHALTLRRPAGRISTARQEKDEYTIASGVFEGKTTGTPIAIIIPNADTRSKDYKKTYGLARPGHADFAAYCKYHGFEDYRGGGHFSGRVTSALVAAGAIARAALAAKGIYLGTHIKELAGVPDRAFDDLRADIDDLYTKVFPVLSPEAEEKMRAEIEKAAAEGDSVGGMLETVVIGMPAGVGEPYFDSLESVIAHMMFSVPGVKGVLFGAGTDFAKMRGSEANDAFRMEDGRVYTKTNNNGGVNGGITNGSPVTFTTVIKPTPSIYKKQETVDFLAGEEKDISIEGRHDPCIAHRARIVVDSLTAIALCDMLAGRYGTDWIKNNE